ncbi:MAG: hypothetical protein ACRCUY_08770, partial [Thermoguttaceae bacterium]
PEPRRPSSQTKMDGADLARTNSPRTDSPRTSQKSNRASNDNRDSAPRQDRQSGERSEHSSQYRTDRRGGGKRDRFDRGPREAKVYIAPAKEKEIKPISEEMKKGKEPLRSFGDLAQFLGTTPTPEKGKSSDKSKK